MTRSFVSLAWLVVLGCTPKDPPIDEPTVSGSEASGGETTGETTTGTPTTGVDGLEESGFVDPTMGEPLDPEATPAEMCMHLCERVDECGADPGFEGCPCVAPLPEYCVETWYEVTSCFDQTSCSELQTFAGPCWDLIQYAYFKCELGEDGCEEFFEVPSPEPPAGACLFGFECAGMADLIVTDMECEGDTCTCFINDVESGSCPSDGVCEADEVARGLKLEACCG